ncbi:hypothetical protein D046_0799A, partial [Vibrio parahaemolyticus V-223/04]
MSNDSINRTSDVCIFK